MQFQIALAPLSYPGSTTNIIIDMDTSILRRLSRTHIVFEKRKPRFRIGHMRLASDGNVASRSGELPQSCANSGNIGERIAKHVHKPINLEHLSDRKLPCGSGPIAVLENRGGCRVVYTENLNLNIAVMKPAKSRVN